MTSDIFTETLPQIRERHRQEVREILERYNAAGFTQTETAKELNATLTQINNLALRNGIEWLVKRQGNHNKWPNRALPHRKKT